MKYTIVSLALAGSAAIAGEAMLTVKSVPHTLAGCATPVAVPVDPSQNAGVWNSAGPIELVESPAAGSAGGAALPAQFEAEAGESPRGALWFLLPTAESAERRFRLRAATNPVPAALAFQADERCGFYDLREGALSVLRYNHGTVPVPDGIPTNYARGDYLMPVFGPHGELLTDDYPKDHPHHRGVGWSWPVTRWGAEVRDLWAVSGVWARPVRIRRLETGPVFALLEADNVWKWGDTNAIVREEVRLRAFRHDAVGRLVDIEVRLTALAEGVAIGGRPHGGYGGFGLRAQPAKQRLITRFTDSPDANPRRSWLDYSGVFAGGAGASGLAIFEHPANPLYPSELKEYAELNYVMPAFPGEREVPLSREKPLVLRHRLWIHEGMATAEQLAAVWAAYSAPPRITFLP